MMRWLLDRLLSQHDRRAIESELLELYELRRAADGNAVARRWLWRQRALYPAYLLIERGSTLAGAIAGRGEVMAALAQDVKHSMRSLRRSAGLAITIVATVGLGLGLTTAMVTLIDAVIVKPLPYADQDLLVWIYTDRPPNQWPLSVADYRAIDEQQKSFSHLAAYETSTVTVTGGPAARRVTNRNVTWAYFSTLGLSPAHGRLFDRSDDQPDLRLAVLSHEFWTSQFGGDRTVVGRVVSIDGIGHTVVGIVSDNGPLGHEIAVYRPVRWPAPPRRGPFFLRAIGRLHPGVTQAAAGEELRAINRRAFPPPPSTRESEWTFGLRDLKSRAVGEVGSTLIFVLAAVACVLIIACVNAVNLLLARAMRRGHELTIRAALGASRRRLLQYLAVETALLAAASAVVGLVIAASILRLIGANGAGYIPRIGEIQFGVPSLLWLGVLSIASCFLIGIVPAIQGARLGQHRQAPSGQRTTTDSLAARRMRGVLVGAEFAIATPLLVAAALVITTLDHLRAVPIGIDDASKVLTASVSLPQGHYPDAAARRTFWERALERVRAIPGVQSVAFADGRPPIEIDQENDINLEDRPTPRGENQPTSPWVGVTPEFFRTIGVPVLEGRVLEAADFAANAPPVVVVDRAWADRFFPGERVLDRRFHSGGCNSCPWTSVVGVVGTVKYLGVDAPDQGTVYWTLDERERSRFIVIRSDRPAALAGSLEQAIRELDPALALTGVATIEDLVTNSLATPRYLTLLVGTFAATAALLSLVGIYGVMTYFVQQHRRDIAIRLALGGDPSQLGRLVIGKGLTTVAIGVVVGLGATFLMSRIIASVLFGVSATDPATIALVPGALIAAALISCALPATRAAGVDPADVLREV